MVHSTTDGPAATALPQWGGWGIIPLALYCKQTQVFKDLGGPVPEAHS